MITNLISAHRNNDSRTGGRPAPGTLIMAVLEHATPSAPMFIPEYWAIRSHRAPSIGRKNIRQTVKRFRTFKGAAQEFNRMCALADLVQSAGEGTANLQLKIENSQLPQVTAAAGLAAIEAQSAGGAPLAAAVSSLNAECGTGNAE